MTLLLFKVSTLRGIVRLNFERLIDEDAPLSEVLPRLYKQNEGRYSGYTIRQLCQELHDFYKENNTKEYQKRLFLRKYFPEQTMSAIDADTEMLHNNVQLIKFNQLDIVMKHFCISIDCAHSLLWEILPQE